MQQKLPDDPDEFRILFSTLYVQELYGGCSKISILYERNLERWMTIKSTHTIKGRFLKIFGC